MLRPELQDQQTFVDSLKNLSITQKRVAEGFMRDGTYEALCLPLQALVTIMINGTFEGKDRNHPEFRQMFTREYVINSDWYKKRLVLKQERDIEFWTKNIAYIQNVIGMKNHKEAVERLNLNQKLEEANSQLGKVKSNDYLNNLVGTLGADPLK